MIVSVYEINILYIYSSYTVTTIVSSLLIETEQSSISIIAATDYHRVSQCISWSVLSIHLSHIACMYSTRCDPDDCIVIQSRTMHCCINHVEMHTTLYVSMGTSVFIYI